MDAATQKLAVKLGDADLAEKLVEAGFRSPGPIRRASDAELRHIKGIGQAAVRRIRERL